VADLRLDTNAVDYAILAAYFMVVLGVGFAARRYIRTSLDYFLSGRSLPAWLTGLAFISANLGATEVLGMAANGAQYGVATVNYYWIGAIPAMVFLGLVMMPFYYGSRVRSGLEYLRLRFSNQAHLFNSVAGVYGMANVDRAAAARRHSWWESPPLLGFTALGLAAILTIVSW
jgi:solute:Na+ symporter, SSS family